ncbi:MAG: hypothetical protein IKV58_02930, partial [Oscillospiraceae bacterium]|nr:hypothetical protein [Oscillospiraceae bacterium]
DINIKNQIVFRFTRFIVLAIILVVTRNFILYLLLDVLNTLASNIHITYVIKKRYKNVDQAQIDPLTKQEKHNIVKYMTSGIFSKIGQTVVVSMDSIIISAFIGTIIVGIYSNYHIVTSGLDTMIYLLFSNITASVGNFAVKKGGGDSEALFKRINLANYSLAFVVTVCMYALISPFVQMWAGESYLLSEATVAIVVLNFYISINQYSVANFMGAVGELYYINRFRSLVEGVVKLIVSIALVKLIKNPDAKIVGVFLGTTVCFLFGRVWMDARTLYKHWFKVPFIQYVKTYVARFILCVAICIASKYVISRFFDFAGLNIITWLAGAIICVIISVATLWAIYSKTDDFKYYLDLCKKLVKKVKIKNNG